MIKTQKSVYDFHRKHKFPYSLELKPNKGIPKIACWLLCKVTVRLSKICIFVAKKYKHDENILECFWRFHLCLEELAEAMKNINNGDISGTCDGLGDLLFVVIGNFVSYRLPAKEIIDEICKSNDTKQARKARKDIRLRSKGSSFQPPNFGKALAVGMERLTEEKQL